MLRKFNATILISRPAGFRTLTGLAIGICLTLLLFLYFGTYARKGTLQGTLLPDQGALRIVAPNAGVLIENRIQEAQHVNAGDVLAVLSLERGRANADGSYEEQMRGKTRDKADLIDKQVRESSRLLAREEVRLKRKLQAISTESAQLYQEILIQQKRIDLAEVNLARQQKLVDQGFFSEAALLLRQDSLLEQKARLENLRRSDASLARDKVEAQEDLRTAPIKNLSTATSLAKDRVVAEQEQIEIEGKQRISIRALSPGIITGVLTHEGDYVGNGQPIAWLMPKNATLKAQLYSSSADVGMLSVGQKVKLRYKAFPPQKFGQQNGVIEAISLIAIDPKDFPPGQGPVAAKEPVFRVTVLPYRQFIQAQGKEFPLGAGYQLEADVIIERRRLVEWIFGPLSGLVGRVSQ